jgi:hypothetical protein
MNTSLSIREYRATVAVARWIVAAASKRRFNTEEERGRMEDHGAFRAPICRAVAVKHRNDTVTTKLGGRSMWDRRRSSRAKRCSGLLGGPPRRSFFLRVEKLLAEDRMPARYPVRHRDRGQS